MTRASCTVVADTLAAMSRYWGRQVPHPRTPDQQRLFEAFNRKPLVLLMHDQMAVLRAAEAGRAAETAEMWWGS